MLRSRALAVCLGVLLLAACGRGGANHERAAAALRAGDLDAVEQALAGDESPEAAALLADAREQRAAQDVFAQRIERIERELAPSDAYTALKELEREAPDAAMRERLELAQSRAYDRRASAATERPRGEPARSTALASATPTKAQAPAKRADEPVAATDPIVAARASVLASMQRRDWTRALAELDMALESAGARADELRELRRDLLQLAETDMEDVLHRAVQVEEASGLEAARDELAREVRRFPTSGRFEKVERELRDLDGRIEILSASEPAALEPEPSALTLGDASAGASGDDLAAESERCLAAARDERPGLARDALVARAREMDRRLELRREIAAARAADAAGFAELGLAAADEQRLEIGGESLAWDALSLDLLKKAARRARLSQDAEIGLAAERVLRGDRAGANGAYAELERLRTRGAMTDVEVWDLVARARNESLPDGGYVFERGDWVVASEHERAAREAELAALESKLAEAPAAARDEALDALVQLGESAQPALARALAARFERALHELGRGNTLDQLGRVAEARRELDRRREEALALIFDEETYFYPYNPPEVDAAKAATYWPVQQRVDALVARVREAWEGGHGAKLPNAFREALADLAWSRARAAEHELELPAAGDLPEWIAGIDARLAEIGLAEFAWGAAERDELASDRAVSERNERLWRATSSYEPAQQAATAEAEQVRITNAYRLMFGRRALAWNPRIQAAARMHSRYMSDTGDFGHFEKDPARRTPGDRMRLAGYELGVSENCHMGGSGPEGAHDGWTHSSGHHRNILNAGHREMASAQDGSYWTQNFGVDTSFLSDLAE